MKMLSKNQLIDDICEAAGFRADVSLEILPEFINRLRTGFERYEKLRKLNPVEFTKLFNRCITLTDARFDDEVDKL